MTTSGSIRITTPVLLLLAFTLFLLSATSAQADPLGPANEVRRGAEAFRLLVEEHGITTDSALEREVENLGDRIVRASAERTYLRFHFAVIKDPRINAAALPGGYVYLTQALCDSIGNFAQGDPVREERILAAALAHEIAHVMRRHHLERFSSLEEVLTLDQVEGGARLAISRDNEFEADQYGAFYMMLAGYDLSGMDDLLALLSTLRDDAKDTLDSTHPGPADRRQAMAAYRDQLAAIVGYYNQARALLATGRDTDLALRCLEEWVLPNFPSYYQVHHALGVAYLRKYLEDRPAESRPCQVAFSFYDFNPPLGQSRGEPPPRYLDLAAREFEQVLDGFSKTSPPYLGVSPTVSAYALVMMEQKRLDRALEFARRAVDLDPGSWTALNNLGVVYYLQGNRPRARDCFTRALAARGRLTVDRLADGKLEPVGTYGPALYNLGLVCRELGNGAAAARNWKYYLALDSSSFWAGRIRKAEVGTASQPAVGGAAPPARPFKWTGAGNPFMVGVARELVERQWGPPESVREAVALQYPSQGLEFQLDSEGIVALVRFFPRAGLSVAGLRVGSPAKELVRLLAPVSSLQIADRKYLDYSPLGMLVLQDRAGMISEVIVSADDNHPAPAAKVEQANGIHLNDDRAMVEDTLGEPTRVIDDPASGGTGLVYEPLGLTVNLQGDRVESLVLATPARERAGEVAVGDSFARVRQVLGAPNLAEEEDDGSRRLVYERRGLILNLSGDVVKIIMIH